MASYTVTGQPFHLYTTTNSSSWAWSSTAGTWLNGSATFYSNYVGNAGTQFAKPFKKSPQHNQNTLLCSCSECQGK